MLFDFRLDFQEHWKSLLKKVNKTIIEWNRLDSNIPNSEALNIFNQKSLNS